MNNARSLTVTSFLFAAVGFVLLIFRGRTAGLIIALLLGLIALSFALQTVRVRPSAVSAGALIAVCLELLGCIAVFLRLVGVPILFF